MPSRLEMANTVSTPARKVPEAKPISSTWIELKARFGITPLDMSATKARTASLNGGTSSGLSSQRPYNSQPSARKIRMPILRSQT